MVEVARTRVPEPQSGGTPDETAEGPASGPAAAAAGRSPRKGHRRGVPTQIRQDTGLDLRKLPHTFEEALIYSGANGWGGAIVQIKVQLAAYGHHHGQDSQPRAGRLRPPAAQP